MYGNCSFEFNETFAWFDSCAEMLCCSLQLCPSSQTSPTAGLPPLLPPDSALSTHPEAVRGQCTQRAQTWAREPCRSTSTQVCCLQISLRQGMKTDSGTLMCLCEKTDNDIRACINTLQVERGDATFTSAIQFYHVAVASRNFSLRVLVQFLHGRGLKRVDLKTIQCVSVGQKDQNKGLFHLWQEVFQLPRTKR